MPYHLAFLALTDRLCPFRSIRIKQVNFEPGVSLRGLRLSPYELLQSLENASMTSIASIRILPCWKNSIVRHIGLLTSSILTGMGLRRHRAEPVYASVFIRSTSLGDGLEDVGSGHGSAGSDRFSGDADLGDVNNAPFFKRILLSDHKKCMLQRIDINNADIAGDRLHSRGQKSNQPLICRCNCSKRFIISCMSAAGGWAGGAATFARASATRTALAFCS